MSGTVTTLAKNRKTPGVYVTEFSAFPPSIVGVATAVPIFVGYTQTASDPSSGKQVYLQAIPLTCMADYYNYFGYGYDAQYIVAAAATNAPYDFQADSSDGTIVSKVNYTVSSNDGTDVVPQFNLYTAMQLFYANGGGNCFVVSVNNYWGTQSTTPTPAAPAVAVSADDLLSGLDVAHDTRGATMLVVPDACLLSTQDAEGNYPDYAKVVVAMLEQAATLQDRVAILDLPAALIPGNWNKAGLAAEAAAFYTAIAAAQPYFSYGAAYAPAVESSILGVSDVNYGNLAGSSASSDTMNMLLTTQALSLYGPVTVGVVNQKFTDVSARIGAAYPPSSAATGPQYSAYVPKLFPTPTTDADILALDQYLCNAVPLLGQVQQILVGKLNVAPPSGVLAGIWTQNDATRGVWNAPANITAAQVSAPKVLLNDDQQGDYNMPLNGNAIDILRAMVNRGTVVWGARTLDGNSLDWRYIQVRRTLIYIEQSIKQALLPFVFAANDGTTWVTVTGMISNFLTGLWQAGGLMGDKASDAFTVQCGLGSTMTGLDVLNGYMIVNVTVQLIHPAEFIELTFTQTMQGV